MAQNAALSTMKRKGYNAISPHKAIMFTLPGSLT